MRIIDALQGTPAWHLARAKSDGTASELPVAAGKSKYQTRNELLRQKATGIKKEVDAGTQYLFDQGHKAESSARLIAESIIDDELYPVTLEGDYYDLILLASLDGQTMDGEIIFEHKLFNKELAQMVIDNSLSEHYTLQMDQQLLISKASKCLFMCSDGTESNMVWCWYESKPSKLNNVVDIWRQFHTDLIAYEHQEVIDPPKAEPIKDLPSVIVQVSGALERCNINEVKPLFDKFLAEAITELVTDEDFAQAEAQAKISRATAKGCKATKEGIINQTLSISEITRDLDYYEAKFNASALQQEKAVKTQKELRKANAKAEREIAFIAHLRSLEDEIKPIRLMVDAPDWAGAMKNQRLLSSLYGKLDDALADSKIRADAIAKNIRLNLLLINGQPSYKFLFHDVQQLVYKDFDDLKIICESRIENHKKAEAEKLEAERKRIQEEEADRAAKVLEAELRRARDKAEADAKEADRLQAQKLETERAEIRRQEQLKAREEANAIALELAESTKSSVQKIEEERKQAALFQALKSAVEAVTIEKLEYDELLLKSKRLDKIVKAIKKNGNLRYHQIEEIKSWDVDHA
jgi:predicted phage-related endonuclease